MALVLFRHGRYEDAREASIEALKRGTLEAMYRYHAGMISQALGDRNAHACATDEGARDESGVPPAAGQ